MRGDQNEVSKVVNVAARSKPARRWVGCAVLCAAVSAAWAQAPAVAPDQQSLPELPNSISGGETVKARMDKFIRDQGLREIKDNKKDETGRDVLIDFATGTIAASPSDKNFVNARIAAFNKAMLNAKAQCAEFQKTRIATEAVMDAARPPAERAREDAEQLRRAGLAQEGVTKVAQALNSDLSGKSGIPQAIRTGALYGEKLIGMKMSEELRKKGLDPSRPVEEQVARTVSETAAFKNMVSTVANARCTGIKALASFEQNPSSGQGQVGIITVWSEKLHAISDAIVTNQWDLIPKGEPGKKIQDHIPNDLRTLLTTFGTQLVRDERGEYVLLAFAQDQPRTTNQQSVDTAYEAAKTRAMGLIRSFMGEAVVTNRALLDAEVSTVFEDGSTRYQDDGSFQRSTKAVGERLPISGLSVAHEWETRHPANDGPVVGVVMQWKVDSARIAAALSRLNQASGDKAQVAAAAVDRTAAPMPVAGTAAPARKSEVYSGQGKVSRDF